MVGGGGWWSPLSHLSHLDRGLPPPSRPEIEQLCVFHMLSTTGTDQALITRLLGKKRRIRQGADLSDEDDGDDTDRESSISRGN